MIHELKTDSAVFQPVLEGKKTFEIRKNDRNFQVGDELWLKETVYTGEEMKPVYEPNVEFPFDASPPTPGKPLEYTGRMVAVTVTYILNGPIYGLIDGWCIMSIERA